MPGATVPEAAIHEDCDFLFWKDKVGLAKKRTVATPSGDVVLAEDFDEGLFCGSEYYRDGDGVVAAFCLSLWLWILRTIAR